MFVSSSLPRFFPESTINHKKRERERQHLLFCCCCRGFLIFFLFSGKCPLLLLVAQSLFNHSPPSLPPSLPLLIDRQVCEKGGPLRCERGKGGKSTHTRRFREKKNSPFLLRSSHQVGFEASELFFCLFLFLLLFLPPPPLSFLGSFLSFSSLSSLLSCLLSSSSFSTRDQTQRRRRGGGGGGGRRDLDLERKEEEGEVEEEAL